MKLSAKCVIVGFLSVAGTQWALAYDLYKPNGGREDRKGTYDLPGLMFPKQNGAIYDFGKFGKFDTLPMGVTHDMVQTAIGNLNNSWGKWANVKFDGSGFLDHGKGLVRLKYAGENSITRTDGYNSGDTHYAELTWGKYITGTTGYTQRNFDWVFKHEIGHVMGLNDLYVRGTEEFVDHPANTANTYPNNPSDATKDNIMKQFTIGDDGYDDTTGTLTDLDNDEIAGLAWLWGSPFNQIVTGDFENAWANTDTDVTGRKLGKHHGQDTEGWWTYRGSIAAGDTGMPLIDIDFAGYKGFEGKAFSDDNPGIEYLGNRGGYRERFRINKAGFSGNFVLKLQSSFKEERRVNSWILGAKTTEFVLDPNLTGLAFQAAGQNTNDRFAKVYGPVPEPASLLALIAGLGLVSLRRRGQGRK